MALSHEGRGIVYYADKPIFVPGALVGEKIVCKILKASRNYAVAKLLAVENKHVDRVNALCAHFNECGGCSLQHLSTAKQLELKQNNLLNQFANFGKVIPEKVLSPIVSKTWHYRRRARLGVKYVVKKDKVLVGFREKDGRFLAQINTCHVLDERVSVLIEPLQDLIYQLSIRSQIPQLEVAVAENKTVLIFRNLASLSVEDQSLCCQFMQSHQEQKVHIYLQPGDHQSIVSLLTNVDVLAKEELLYYRHQELNLKYVFAPTDFVQINADLNIKMINLVLKYLQVSPNDTVLDLFSGIGNITLALARTAKAVVGVEGEHILTNRAKYNARLNNITNAEFFTANLFESPKDTCWWKKEYTKLVLDPARTGAKEIIEQLRKRKNKFKQIVYVSCNPATLARDAGLLVNELGYSCTQIQLLDMFPHTAHVESIAVFA